MFGWLRKLFGGSSAPPREPTDTSPKGVYSTLRHKALTMHREDVGLTSPPIQSPAWGVIMESSYPTATATLFTLSNGHTSLYLSTGAAVLGGEGHEPVRKAVARFVEAANGLIQHLSRTSSTPVPATGSVVFYALTDATILTAAADRQELASGRHPLSPLFFAGHGVLAELRKISGAKTGTPSASEL
jgi:hypothetical protein